MKIIGIHGNTPGAGKDLAGEMIAAIMKGTGSHLAYHQMFAKKLKVMISTLTGIPLSVTTSEFYEYPIMDFTRVNKEKYLPRWGMTLREMLQKFATEVCRDTFDEDIWIKGLETDMQTSVGAFNIVPDLRFPNEMAYIAENYGLTIYIKRDLEDLPEDFETASDKAMGHKSEGALNPSDFDIVINNKGTKENLFDELLVKLKEKEILPKDYIVPSWIKVQICKSVE